MTEKDEMSIDIEESAAMASTTINSEEQEDGELIIADETIDDDEEKDQSTKQQKPKKKKNKEGKVGKTYPTRYMLIGQIHCLFLSFYYKGKSPFLTLGPSWPFTSVLIVLGLLILFYFYIMMSMATKAYFLHKLWC